jgi:hypothetical protein
MKNYICRNRCILFQDLWLSCLQNLQFKNSFFLLQESVRNGTARALVHAVQVEKSVHALWRGPTSLNTALSEHYLLRRSHSTKKSHRRSRKVKNFKKPARRSRLWWTFSELKSSGEFFGRYATNYTEKRFSKKSVFSLNLCVFECAEQMAKKTFSVT